MRRLVRIGLAVGFLVGLTGCFPPDNTAFRVLDNVPYDPTDAADLVVGTWGELSDLQNTATTPRVVDVHRATPAPPANAPVFVWIPGGAWIAQNQNTLPKTLERYVAQGWVVVTVGYTGANATVPEQQWPVPGQEIDWVVRWVKANAGALGVDPDKLVLGGHSAGAHLAAMTATGRFDGTSNPIIPTPAGGDPSLRTAFTSHPSALLLLAGPYDLSSVGVPYHFDDPANSLDADAWLQQELLGCKPAADPPEAVNPSRPTLPICPPSDPNATPPFVGPVDSASPVYWSALLGNMPPTFLAQTGEDPLVPVWPNMLRFGNQLCTTGTVSTWAELLPGSDHEVGTLDWAKVDYFLHVHGLLGAVPKALPTASCNPEQT